jgi:CRISPR-associated protein Cas2
VSMTVVVTRDVEGRYRGFLGSCMLELAPGVYTAPRMTRGIRERVWRVVESWHGELGQGSIVMTWAEPGLPGGRPSERWEFPQRRSRTSTESFWLGAG